MVQILNKYGESSIDDGKVVVIDKYGKIKSFSGGGSGTVTSFSSGNLSPLFNTSVATPTTTPALSFSQISQAQNLFFASPNGSSGVPTFRAIVAADLPSLSSTYVPVTRNITINGTTFDLSADRTWSVGIVTSLSAGTGISIGGTSSIPIVTNTAPDQTVVLTAGTGISITGTYPSFTITNSSPSSGGTVTSVAALTLGTTGTDLSSSVANSTTTPVITLNVPTASATNRGALSSTDWTTFNNKVSMLHSTGVQSAIHTGTTANTLVTSYLINANDIADNQTIDFEFKASKLNTTAGGIVYRVYINTSASLVGATQIAQYNPASVATVQGFTFRRRFTRRSGNLLFLPATSITTGITDYIAFAGTVQTASVNFAVNQFIIVSVELAVSGQQVVIESAQILRI